MIARNVLFFTLLFDNIDSNDKTLSDYWTIFYDLHVNPKTLSVIRKHSKNLVNLSKDMETWTTSAYDRVLRIVNIETLNILREYWQKYANYTDPDRSQFFRFRSQCKYVYETTPS